MSDEASIRTPTYRVARGRGMDPATKRLALIAAGLGSALLVVIGLWSLDNHHGGAASVPVIQPPPGPMRVKPANPGGMKLAPDDGMLSLGSAGGDGTDTLAPPPESPDLQALRPPPKPVAAVSAPVPPAAPAPAAVGMLPPGSPPLPVPPIPEPPSVSSGPAASPSAVSPSGTPVTVQLAALPTEAAARQQWALLQRRLPDLLHGRSVAISQVDLGGHPWWRVRTAGFTGPAAADSFCEQVRAKGAACDVVRP